MILGPAKSEDALEVIAILKRCNHKLLSQEIYQWDDQYPSQELIENNIISKSLFVYRNDGHIISGITLDDKQPPSYSKITWGTVDANPLLIHRTFVDPDFQGQGLGQAMMNFAESYAPLHDFNCIRADVHKHNLSALALFQKRDYKVCGELMFPRREVAFVCFEKAVIHDV